MGVLEREAHGPEKFGLSADFFRCACAALPLDVLAAAHRRLVGTSGGDVFEKLHFPRVAVSLYSCAACFVVAKSPVEFRLWCLTAKTLRTAGAWPRSGV